MATDDQLDELRRKKMVKLQQRTNEEKKREEIRKNLEREKEALLNKILTQKARQRLRNLKMVKPEFISQLELQIIQLAQQGRITIPLEDDQLKQILIQLQSQKREPKIRRI